MLLDIAGLVFLFVMFPPPPVFSVFSARYAKAANIAEI